jgi:hypothetical protein
MMRVITLALIVASSLSATEVAIGQLNLMAQSNPGYTGDQIITFSNNTDTVFGCNAIYEVCSGLDVTSWNLTVTFTDESAGNPSATYSWGGPYTSPLVIPGPGADIAPGVQGYSGSTTTWVLPLSFENSDPTEPLCPPCDYQITQIEFSGTLSAIDIPAKLYNGSTYNAGDPSTYTTFTPQVTFDDTWVLPTNPTDYDGITDPEFFNDPTGFNVLVSDQPVVSSSVPEPATLVLIGAGLAVFGSWKRRTSR